MEPRYDEVKLLREQGRSYRQISRMLEVPLGTVHRWSQVPLPETPPIHGDAEMGADLGTDVPTGDGGSVLDLSTSGSILAEIDRVYVSVAAQGYTAKAALQLKALQVKLDALRREKPSPCVGHLTSAVVTRRISELVEATMQEFRSALGGADKESRAATDAAVVALFERVKIRFNGCLRAFDQEGSWYGDTLIPR